MSRFVLGPDHHGVRVLIEGSQAQQLSDCDPVPADARHVTCPSGEIQSGTINAHTHIYSGLAPLGLPAPSPPPTNFVEILERVWWKLDRALDHASLEASAHLYLARALLCGTTTLIDHHESPSFIDGSLDVLAEACETLGIRACLCFGATERNRGIEEARRGLWECQRFIRSGETPLLRGVVGLHASFTVSDDALREAAKLCETTGKIMHVHVAEDRADVRDAIQRGYPGPFERLQTLGALPPGSILAHGLYLDARQVRATAEADCWIVQNPRSNHGNRVGYPQALTESSRVALGTDGYPADMEAEATFLVAQANEHGESENQASPRITAACRLVEQLFGQPVGLPQPGQTTLADLRITDETGVRHVFVHGRHVVCEGELHRDLAAIEQRANIEAQRLWARMEALT